MTLVKWGSER